MLKTLYSDYNNNIETNHYFINRRVGRILSFSLELLFKYLTCLNIEIISSDKPEKEVII